MARLTKLEDNVLVKRVRDEGDQFAFGALMEKVPKAYILYDSKNGKQSGGC